MSEHLVRSAEARGIIARLYSQLAVRDLNDRRELVASVLSRIPRSTPPKDLVVAVFFESRTQVMCSSGATTFERGEVISDVSWLSELLMCDAPSMRWLTAAAVRALENAIPEDLRDLDRGVA